MILRPKTTRPPLPLEPPRTRAGRRSAEFVLPFRPIAYIFAFVTVDMFKRAGSTAPPRSGRRARRECRLLLVVPMASPAKESKPPSRSTP